MPEAINLEDDLDDDEMSDILSQNDLPIRKKSYMREYNTNTSLTKHKETLDENFKLKNEIMKLKDEIFKTSQLRITQDRLDQTSQLTKSISKMSGRSGKSDLSINMVNNALNLE